MFTSSLRTLRILSVVLFVVLFLSKEVRAFSIQRPALPRPPSALFSDSSGKLEQLEFKIYPDGRVEETVRGIKGGQCHSVTESINEALGVVTNTAPTEEMYEQELNVEQTLYNQEGWEGSTSW